ncbi:hypothetical protein ACHAQA_004087 [Verticillium albo-atrum]
MMLILLALLQLLHAFVISFMYAASAITILRLKVTQSWLWSILAALCLKYSVKHGKLFYGLFKHLVQTSGRYTARTDLQSEVAGNQVTYTITRTRYIDTPTTVVFDETTTETMVFDVETLARAGLLAPDYISIKCDHKPAHNLASDAEVNNMEGLLVALWAARE